MKYLIRHAEKTDSRVHANLTEKGIIDAKKYGQELRSQNIHIDKIVTSPIHRCVQTAQSIVVGLKYNIPIVKSIKLGNPGVYISDDKKAMEVFNNFSLLDIINMQLRKKILPGFNHIESASLELNSFIHSFSENVLFISHDAVIIPFVSWLYKKNEINHSDLIDYLYTCKFNKKSEEDGEI